MGWVIRVLRFYSKALDNSTHATRSCLFDLALILCAQGKMVEKVVKGLSRSAEPSKNHIMQFSEFKINLHNLQIHE